MKIVVGLGNPGRKYSGTRHNVGFEVVDRLAAEAGIRLRKSWRTDARAGRMRVDEEDLLLVKPESFMNRSGRAVGFYLRAHRLAAKDLIVVVDDVDLPLGRLRVRQQGSAGGHNGLKSIIEAIGGDQFVRVRIGVGGKPEDGDLADHVLAAFDRSERSVVEKIVPLAGEAVLSVVREGVDEAMNRFNHMAIASEGGTRE